jgi:hypothetical protein
LTYKQHFYWLFFLILSTNAIAQSTDFVEIRGTILREDSLSPIYGAVIVNKNNMLGTLSNKIGNFKMRVKPGDTLQISHIAFVTHLIIFNDQKVENDLSFNIIMKLRSYELPGIDVRRYRIRQRYREQATSMRRTDNITYDAGTIKLENTGPIYYNPWSNAGANALPMPVFGIPIGDLKEMRRQEQLAKVAVEEAKDRRKKYINRKYSKELVNQLTGLKGNEMENFLNFCKPSDDAIFKANEYELTYLILDCYKRFKEEND